MSLTRRTEAGAIGVWVARPLGPAIILLAVACLCSPARGQHCGSYVIQAGDHVLEAALGLSAETVRQAAESPQSADRLPERPCDGPFCSKAPAAPNTPPAPPLRSAAEHWAIVDLALPSGDPDTTPLPGSEEPLRPRHLVGGVFHPPRSD